MSDWWTPEVLDAVTEAVRAEKGWEGYIDVKPALRAIGPNIIPRVALEDDQVRDLFATAIMFGFQAASARVPEPEPGMRGPAPDAAYWGREYQEQLLALLDRLMMGAQR